MKYIIMCGGHYKRWKTPKHLTMIKGEPLVGRTIRLLRENRVKDISISSDNPIFEQFGVPVLKHENSYSVRGYNDFDGYWCDAFYPTTEPTCYIFGDVLYSPEAIKKIVDYQGEGIMFFGSKRPFSKKYPKTHVEPFAFKVWDTDRLKEACEKVKDLDRHRAFLRKPLAWELWYVICGAPINQDAEHIEDADYVAINDYTCDIDDPWEIKEW